MFYMMRQDVMNVPKVVKIKNVPTMVVKNVWIKKNMEIGVINNVLIIVIICREKKDYAKRNLEIVINANLGLHQKCAKKNAQIKNDVFSVTKSRRQNAWNVRTTSS